MKQSSTIEASVEHTSIGRVVVPPNVPEGFRLFYTTMDIDGRITPEVKAFVGVPLATGHQVHGNRILRGTPGPEPECDALWSDEMNIALGIKVADCLPVTLIDAKNGIMANIHSGWRGTVQRITEAALDAAPLHAADTVAFLGPSIRVCCFEVGEEVAAQFDERFIDRTRGSKPHVDIAAHVAGVLRNRGVARIVDTGLCTRCEGSLFHSYRRDKRGGRNLAIVAR